MAFPGAVTTKTIRVPHLGGTSVAYHLAKPLKGSKPTLVLINGVTGAATQWRAQIDDQVLVEAVNVIAVEPLGHGNTRTKSPTYTLWDSAAAILQALEALGISKFIVLGASMGGWIAARIALYAPEKVLGLIFVGSNLDSAGSQGAIERGCPNASEGLTPILTQLTAEPNPDFTIPPEFFNGFDETAFGPNAKPEIIELWKNMVNAGYKGDDGRLRLQQAIIGLLTRESLHLRASSITQPFLWIQGSNDKVFSVENAKFELGLTKSVEPRLEVIEGAAHSPNWTHSAEVDKLVFEFVKKHGGKIDARALREAVGTVDI